MATTALDLITRSYYLSQVVSRGLQVVSGEQIADGLSLLNYLLEFKSSDLRHIPFFTYTEFDSVIGQEEYFLENVLQIDTATFNIGVVRYPMVELSRHEYFATGRIDNVESLPFSYRQERVKGGTNFYMYFVPAGVYQVKIMAKYALTDVTLQTEMDTVYPAFYIEYLRYALAEYICSEYGATFPDESKAKLMELEKKVMDVSPKDLKANKKSYFSANPPISWGLVNLPGWVP